MDIHIGIDETVRKTLFQPKPSCCGTALRKTGDPCPSCGSTSYPVLVPGKLKITTPRSHNSISSRKVGIELVVDDSWNHERQKLVKVERLVDRNHNSYSELVTDPDTQQVIRRREEPLKKHRDRGSARNKQK